MTNINNLEMGFSISNHPHILVRKTLFGLRKQLVYQPTQSLVDVIINDYNEENGALVERVLRASKDKLEETVKTVGKVQKASISNMRLEVCLSRDHHFAAFQLFRFSDFKYHPITDVRCFEGKDASLVAQML